MTTLGPYIRYGARVTGAAIGLLLLVASACTTSISSSPGGTGGGSGSSGGGSCPCTVGNSGIHFTLGCGQSSCIQLNGQAIGYTCGQNGATEDPSICSGGGPDSGTPGFDAGPSCVPKSCAELSLCGNATDNCGTPVTCPGCPGGLLCSQGNHCVTPASNLIVIGNYQGGAFTIIVDQHLPNLGIGLVSYNAMQVSIAGSNASDVVQVLHAGYDPGSTVSGVPQGIFADKLLPPASPDAGPGDLIVDDIPNSPTMPTKAEIVAYFQNAMGGGTLDFHQCQYAAYTGAVDVMQPGTCN